MTRHQFLQKCNLFLDGSRGLVTDVFAVCICPEVLLGSISPLGVSSLYEASDDVNRFDITEVEYVLPET